MSEVEIEKYADAEHLTAAAGHRLVRTIAAAVEARGVAHVVLTGEIPSAAQPPAVASRVPNRERGFDRGFANDDDLAREFARGENYNDDDGYAPLRQTRRQRFQRGWQESNDGPRYYYYRSTPAPRRYDDAPFQFLFGR